MIQFKDIRKSFHSQEILKGITAEVRQGEVVAIIGPSGGGKSTLLRCVNGLETFSSGSITVNGLEVTPASLKEIRDQVGMVFQNFNLFSNMTVLKNLTYAPLQLKKGALPEVEKKARELLEKVGLAHKAGAYPKSLSGGEKQRVAIARTLMVDPKVILFDEPTSALDPERVQEVLQVIRGLAHTGITILIVTHEMGFVKEVADRVLCLKNGVIEKYVTTKEYFS